MRSLLLSLLGLLFAVPASQAAPAQQRMSVPLAYLDANQDKRVEEAFSSGYGRLLLNELAATARNGVDAACDKAKGVTTADFDGRIRAIAVRHGVQLIKAYVSAVDQTAFKATFATRMGGGAINEVTRLRNDPDVRTFLELGAPIQHAAVVNTVLEMVERYALVLKIKLGRFHPFSTGKDKLITADPTEATLDKLDGFIASRKSAALNRYIEMMAAMQETLNQSIDAKRFLAMRIVDLMPGLDTDLAGICVLRAP